MLWYKFSFAFRFDGKKRGRISVSNITGSFFVRELFKVIIISGLLDKIQRMAKNKEKKKNDKKPSVSQMYKNTNGNGTYKTRSVFLESWKKNENLVNLYELNQVLY